LPMRGRFPRSPGTLPAQARRARAVALYGVCLAIGLAGLGCEVPTGPGPGHRPQRLALSPRQELELGRQAYRELLSRPERFGRVIPADRPECQRVRDIARRLIHASEIEPLRREMNLR